MITVTEETIANMVDAIIKEVDPERVYLFGSRARGEGAECSDIDLLIVEREPFGPARSRLQELARVRSVLSLFRVPKDILVYSTDEFSKWQHSVNHIVADCVREGKLLYARP